MTDHNLDRIASFSGWASLALLVFFFSNIGIGKYMHLKKISIVAPINGVSEFLLFGLIILLFSTCALLRERAKQKAS
jgi:hypothetical protein